MVLGSLIGRKVGIFPKAHDDWLVIPNLWGAVVGRPSLLKSPAIAEIMKPLGELASQAIERYRHEQQLHEQKEMWLDAQKGAQKKEQGCWPDSDSAIWALRAGSPDNGFGEAFVTIGRRVLIDEEKFWEAIARLQEVKNASGK